MLIVAEEYRPPEIHMPGMDSYDPKQLHHQEIPLWEKLRDRPDSWCQVVNEGMGKFIKTITNMYTETKFYYHGPPPAHALKEWRVEYV